MTVLVTGAAGFIGSTLAARLVREGRPVRGIDSFTDYYLSATKQANLDRIPNGAFEFVRADLSTSDLAALLEGVDTVFHLAAQPGVNQSWGDAFHSYTRQNVDATQRLLEQCVASGIRRFVYASSSSIYGNATEFPTRESTTPRPYSPYGVSKLAGEHLVAAYADNFGLSAATLRFFTVFGPGQRPDMAFTRFLEAALSGATIVVNGSGEQIRDFTYVDDVVDALLRAGAADTAGATTFNVAGGSDASVNEVLAIIESIHGSRLAIERVADKPGDVRRTGGATELIRDALGWSPAVDLEQGIRLQFDWLRDARAGQ